MMMMKSKLNYNYNKMFFISTQPNNTYHEYDNEALEMESELNCMREFKSPFTEEDEFSNFNIVFQKYRMKNILNDYLESNIKKNNHFLQDLKKVLKTKREKSITGSKEVVRHTLKIKRKLK